MTQKNLTRLNKYISSCGISSRRKAEEYILQDRVTVNGNIVKSFFYKIDPEIDKVCIDGEPIRPKEYIYLLMNKPKGVITTTKDEKDRKTVIDLVDTNEKVYPVGRLDFNTTGVLFLTNDGYFANLLTHPRNRVPRIYEAKLEKPLSNEDREKLLKGIILFGRKGRFIKINFPQQKNKKFIEVTCMEGRNHFVKNMFGAVGYTISSLNRKKYAGIKADIPPGSYRKLSKEEVGEILQKYGK